MRMQDDRLAGVRTERSSLRQALGATERALAAPLPRPPQPWQSRLASCLDQLGSAWERHVVVTEGNEGLFAQIGVDAPQLAPKLRRLHQEHTKIGSDLAALRTALAEPATVEEATALRSRATAVLTGVMRHRQHGADLIYEAYDLDIGGE